MKKLLIIFLVLFIVACSTPTDDALPELDEDQNAQETVEEDINGEEDFSAYKDEDGTIYYEGTVLKPTPCHEIEKESFAEFNSLIVTLELIEPQEGIICSQVISPSKISDFNDEDLDEIEIYLNGELVLYEVFS